MTAARPGVVGDIRARPARAGAVGPGRSWWSRSISTAARGPIQKKNPAARGLPLGGGGSDSPLELSLGAIGRPARRAVRASPAPRKQALLDALQARHACSTRQACVRTDLRLTLARGGAVSVLLTMTVSPRAALVIELAARRVGGGRARSADPAPLPETPQAPAWRPKARTAPAALGSGAGSATG